MQQMEPYFSILLCRPAYGGKFCEGTSRSYKLCNTEDCPPNAADYRAQQCAEFNGKQFRGWYYSWRPYTRVDGETTVTHLLVITQEKLTWKYLGGVFLTGYIV